MIEEVAGRWILDLLGLPADSSFAFVTGGQMANATALAAARNHVLAAAGWDVEAGLVGAPAIRLVVGDEVHVTIPRAARLLGLGTRTIEHVAVDANGAMVGADLRLVGLDQADSWSTDAHKWLNVPWQVIERCCAHARRFGEVLGAQPGSKYSTTSC